MPKVYNQSKDIIPEGAIYIGRPSKWGNPFIIGPDGTREQVIELYKNYLFKCGLIKDIKELTGKDLVCWCAPKVCHGDVLLKLANEKVA